MRAEPRLYGTLVTFRRSHMLPATLARLLGQSRQLAALYVIDNEPTLAGERIVGEAALAQGCTPVHYVAAPENLGPAGGWALGMKRILSEAEGCDWIVTLDDNNPPVQRSELEEVFEFALAQSARDPHLAGVGVTGARFNWRSGYISRVADAELAGSIPVDYLGGGFLPMYRVGVVQDVGPCSAELFFGFVELEYGLRLRRAGYTLSALGHLWLERRRLWGRCNADIRPSPFCKLHWQKYYRIRNYIAMMLRFGRRDLAIKWALIQCLAKPLCSSAVSPMTGYRGFRQAWMATRDGFRQRLGRTINPPPGPPTRD